MTADRPSRGTPSGAGTRRSLIIGAVASALALGLCAWLIVTDAPAYRFVVRVYEDKQLMHAMLDRWGVLAPVRPTTDDARFIGPDCTASPGEALTKRTPDHEIRRLVQEIRHPNGGGR